MVKDWVLKQKKGFWSMVKERKDIEHDLGLIETKIWRFYAKISRTNVPDKAQTVRTFLKNMCQCRMDGTVRANLGMAVGDHSSLFCCFALRTGTVHAKLSTTVPSSSCLFSDNFRPKSPWVVSYPNFWPKTPLTRVI